MLQNFDEMEFLNKCLKLTRSMLVGTIDANLVNTRKRLHARIANDPHQRGPVQTGQTA